MSDILEVLAGIDASSFKSAEDCKKATREVHALLSRIETPSDSIFRWVWMRPTQMAALKVAMNLGLFAKWMELNNGASISSDKLLDLVQCHPELFERTLRHLAATYVLWTSQRNCYEMTPFAKSLVTEEFDVLIDFLMLSAMPLCLNLPKFLKGIDHQNPQAEHDHFKDWSGDSLWQYMSKNPEPAANFDLTMQSSSRSRGNFSEIYPCHDLECDSGEVLVVDIAGGRGHDLRTFKAKYPEKKGRLVLQDLPHVIEKADASSNAQAQVEAQAYDFFQPQPVAGAKIYLLHCILHDWPDSDARRILEALKPALKKGHSKLLIQDIVIPPEKPDLEDTSRDWIMMYMNSGVERTEKQWVDLITSAGFKINKIWRNSLLGESVIETEVASEQNGHL